jgi:hypothetical protein
MWIIIMLLSSYQVYNNIYTSFVVGWFFALMKTLWYPFKYIYIYIYIERERESIASVLVAVPGIWTPVWVLQIRLGSGLHLTNQGS